VGNGQLTPRKSGVWTRNTATLRPLSVTQMNPVLQQVESMQDRKSDASCSLLTHIDGKNPHANVAVPVGAEAIWTFQ